MEKAGIDPAAAAPSQPDRLDDSRSDHLAGSKESDSWRALRQRFKLTRSTWVGPVRPGCSPTLVSFSSFSLFPTPIYCVSPNRCLEARHEAVSFEPVEWSDRLPSRRSGWLGAAAAGSIPAFSTFFSILFLFFLRQYSSSVAEPIFTLFKFFFFTLAKSHLTSMLKPKKATAEEKSVIGPRLPSAIFWVPSLLTLIFIQARSWHAGYVV